MSGMGGITVVGMITGGYFIEDIRVSVPHRVAVTIPIETVLQSKDLHRAIGQRAIFKLDGGGYQIEPTPFQGDAASTRVIELEAKNEALTKELEITKSINAGLQEVLVGLQKQMSIIQAGIGRLESTRPATITHSIQGSVVPRQSEAVGGEAPSFIPGEITPKDATSQISVNTQVSEGTTLHEAGNKLREMRRKPPQG